MEREKRAHQIAKCAWILSMVYFCRLEMSFFFFNTKLSGDILTRTEVSQLVSFLLSIMIIYSAYLLCYAIIVLI